MRLTINNDELAALNAAKSPAFPKYTSQLMNWANQNAQGTRPRVVGKLSELFPEYERQADITDIEGWKEWYLSKYPNAMEEAAKRIWNQIENLKAAIGLIDEDMVKTWVEDLVITKTYNGLCFQEAILKKLSQESGKPYRPATGEEESRGIDGYVGDIAYSIKPDTFRFSNARSISDDVDVRMIYYTKKKTGISFEVED